MKQLILLFIIFFNFLVLATPSLVAPRHSIMLQNPDTGKQSSFISDGITYLKVESSPKQMAENPKWFTEVSIVTKDGEVVSKSKMKTSRKTLFDNVGLSLPPSQQVFDTNKGKSVLAKEGLSFIVEGRYVKNKWDYLQIYFVDKEGNIVDHNGIPSPKSPFRFYRLSTKVFDVQLTEGMIKAVEGMNESPLDTFYCPQNLGNTEELKLNDNDIDSLIAKILEEDQATSSAPTVSLRPKARPKPKPVPKVTNKVSSYMDLMEKRRWFLKTYPSFNKCSTALRNYEKERKGKIWPSTLSLKERAAKVYSQSKKTYKAIINNSNAKMKKQTKTSYNETHNPHVIHPILSPELMSCIAYQETHGKLDPQVINYTYCEQRHPIRSSAYGFPMLTRDAMSDLRYYKPHDKVVNQLPITTVKSVNGVNVSGNLSLDKMRNVMSDSLDVQFEFMARKLNYNLKHYNWSKKSKSDIQRTLLIGVGKYDGDDKENYLDSVLNKCLPCMNNIRKNGGDPISCHNKMK